MQEFKIMYSTTNVQEVNPFWKVFFLPWEGEQYKTNNRGGDVFPNYEGKE